MRRPIAPTLATLCAIGGVIAVTVWALDPSLLLSNTTTTGGDTGAHVALAGFLKSNLLPHGHVTGWDPGAYDGFPLNTYYFPLPDTIAALLGYIIPFNIAFKLATVLGSLTLPVAAWAFGRLAGLERPIPAVLAAFTLPFLFDQTFTIYGGNLYSTLAGEYAYSLGLSVALVFLGVTIRGMRTGRLRVSAALLLAATMLCHIVAGGFAIVGAVVVFVVCGPSWRRLWWMVTVGATGLLLVAWWAVPFVLEQAYTTNMGWQNVTTYAMLLAPGADRWALAGAVVGLGFAIFRFRTRGRPALMLAIVGSLSALGVVYDPQGKLYNVRLLPLWLLCVYLVAGYGLAELGIGAAQLKRSLRVKLWREAAPTGWELPLPATSPGLLAASGAPGPLALIGGPAAMAMGPGPGVPVAPSSWAVSAPAPPRSPESPGITGAPDPWRPPRSGPPPWWKPRWAPGAVTVPIIALLLVSAVVVPDLLVSPGSNIAIGPVHLRPDNVPAWSQWNYTGYEQKAGWPELHNGIIATMDRLTKRYGCGRAMWEYNSNENRFGTPEALMNLPYWTGGCVASQEGLLFESSDTTPYHFLDQAELSVGPSEAVSGLDYGPVNVPLGVQHLQLLGVKYFMAFSPEVVDEANADPSLSLIASSGPWHTPYNGAPLDTTWDFYLVHDAPVVSALTERPTVLVGTAPGQTTWLPEAQKWYADPAGFSQELVTGGPSSWPRATAGTVVAPAPLPVAHVTDVHMGTDSISFHVDRTGVPVLVAISYFPAWHASGASGPWRAEPNLMVVDPTSHDVTLTYGTTSAGQLGLALTVVGLVGVIVFYRRREVLTVP